MAANYGELKSIIKTEFGRNDATDAQIDSAAQDGIRRVQRSLRTPSMERAITLTAQDNRVPIPADYLEMRHLYDLANNIKFERVELGIFLERPTSGTPRWYTRSGGDWLFRPPLGDGQEISLDYYAEIPPMVEDDDTHNLLQVAHDALVYYGLSWLANYWQDERMGSFETRGDKNLAEIKLQLAKGEDSEGNMVIEPAYDIGY